ncbi:unnamed protein product [Prorocentrum cordatum]|uniref:Uncharacterized protein n=1 Tax=Prorocentrum cordatum TaxID=2364126 RepID=A0ABN9TAU6_9DINO|nr:unnamed protein product [Polarella glacialis]
MLPSAGASQALLLRPKPCADAPGRARTGDEQNGVDCAGIRAQASRVSALFSTQCAALWRPAWASVCGRVRSPCRRAEGPSRFVAQVRDGGAADDAFRVPADAVGQRRQSIPGHVVSPSDAPALCQGRRFGGRQASLGASRRAV